MAHPGHSEASFLLAASRATADLLCCEVIAQFYFLLLVAKVDVEYMDDDGSIFHE